MTTYRNIADFFEDLVLNQGMTDVQSHVGFANIYGETVEDVAARLFSGKVIEAPKVDPGECERMIYVYIDNPEYLKRSDIHLHRLVDWRFVIEDISGQKIACWMIEA